MQGFARNRHLYKLEKSYPIKRTDLESISIRAWIATLSRCPNPSASLTSHPCIPLSDSDLIFSLACRPQSDSGSNSCIAIRRRRSRTPSSPAARTCRRSSATRWCRRHWWVERFKSRLYLSDHKDSKACARQRDFLKQIGDFETRNCLPRVDLPKNWVLLANCTNLVTWNPNGVPSR